MSIGGEALDKFRHPEFQDDVRVVFIPTVKDYTNLEMVWVRLREQVNDMIFKGVLLNDFINPERYSGLKQCDDVLILFDGDSLLGLPVVEKDNGKFGFTNESLGIVGRRNMDENKNCIDCCYYQLISCEWYHLDICHKGHNDKRRFNELHLSPCKDYRENFLIKNYYKYFHFIIRKFKIDLYYLFHPKARKMNKVLKKHLEEKQNEK